MYTQNVYKTSQFWNKALTVLTMLWATCMYWHVRTCIYAHVHRSRVIVLLSCFWDECRILVFVFSEHQFQTLWSIRTQWCSMTAVAGVSGGCCLRRTLANYSWPSWSSFHLLTVLAFGFQVQLVVDCVLEVSSDSIAALWSRLVLAYAQLHRPLSYHSSIHRSKMSENDLFMTHNGAYANVNK